MVDLVKYAFISGEISPTLYARGDLTKYDLGMAQALNYFVDYRGGLSTRPGFEFVDFVKHDEQNTKFIEYAFSPDLSNTYVLLFGHLYLRFIQDGGYVLEAAKTLTGVASDVFTSVAHGYANGNWIKISGVVGMTELNGRTFQVDSATANTFKLLYVPDLSPVDTDVLTAYVSGGALERIYEIATPFTGDEISALSGFQYRNLVRLTHGAHAIYNLVRTTHTSWALTLETIGASHSRPAVTSHTVQNTASCEVVFAVTAVLDDGTETIRSALYRINNTNNYRIKEGGVKINFSGIAGARYYNIYKSVISTEPLNEGVELGYAGRSNGGSFPDPNIVPDFTKKPPINFNPFAPGAVDIIDLTAGGAGYTTFGTTISITTSTGSGFVGTAVVTGGAVVGVEILDHGKGYAPGDTVAFGGGGAGATATLTLLDVSGVFPASSATFQQRQVYGASIHKPLTVWGSQPKLFSNFNKTENIIASDAFEFELDSPSIAPIKHMLVVRAGLLLLSQASAYILNGGNDRTAITPINAFAESQGYNGVSALRPIPIGSEILIVEGKGYAVRLLSYSELNRVYDGDDRSILSSHLFGPNRELTAWCYQESPYKVVWGVKSDGRLTAFTTVKGEDVYAWTPGETRGLFKDIINVREGSLDRVYVMVSRYVNGRWTKMVERMAQRNFTNVEDAWCVDAGLTNVRDTPAADLTIVETGTTATILASAGVFSAGDVGSVIRAAGGRYEVTAYHTSTSIDVNIVVAAVKLVPQSDIILQPVSSGWDIAAPETVFSGLWHLEGETVKILGDGNVFPPQVVTNGAITLPDAVTQVIIGLGFQCVGRSLPTVINNAAAEARRKRTTGVAVRFDASRGLKVGQNLDQLYDLKERMNETPGLPVAAYNGIKHVMLSTTWGDDNQTYFVMDDPLPATLLGFVFDVEVGDDTD